MVIGLAVTLSEVYLHRSWWTSLDAYTAGDTLFIIEFDLLGYRVNLKSIGGADGYASTTVGTPLFITDNILAE